VLKELKERLYEKIKATLGTIPANFKLEILITDLLSLVVSWVEALIHLLTET